MPNARDVILLIATEDEDTFYCVNFDNWDDAVKVWIVAIMDGRNAFIRRAEPN